MFSVPKNNAKVNSLQIISEQDVTVNNISSIATRGGAYVAKTLKVDSTLDIPTLNISNIKSRIHRHITS